VYEALATEIELKKKHPSEEALKRCDNSSFHEKEYDLSVNLKREMRK